MTYSNKELREGIKEIILKNHTYLQYGMLMRGKDMQAADDITNDILSLIHKRDEFTIGEIEKVKKKIKESPKHGIEERRQYDAYRDGLKESQDIIRSLGKK